MKAQIEFGCSDIGHSGKPCRTRYNRVMNSGSAVLRSFVALFLLIVVGSVAFAQGPAAEEAGASASSVAEAPSAVAKPAEAHRFWDRQNTLLFAGIGASRALDYASTRNMQRRGREEMLLPDDVANNTAAFVAVEAAGTATSIGISYLLHRTGHHKLERWLSIGHIGVTTFGAARNFALDTKR